jgi:hypothetical protein
VYLTIYYYVQAAVEFQAKRIVTVVERVKMGININSKGAIKEFDWLCFLCNTLLNIGKKTRILK